MEMLVFHSRRSKPTEANKQRWQPTMTRICCLTWASRLLRKEQGLFTFSQLTSTQAEHTRSDVLTLEGHSMLLMAGSWKQCSYWLATQKHLKRQPLQSRFNPQGRSNTPEPVSPDSCMCIENHTTFYFFNPSEQCFDLFLILCKCLNILPFKVKSLD